MRFEPYSIGDKFDGVTYTPNIFSSFVYKKDFDKWDEKRKQEWYAEGFDHGSNDLSYEYDKGILMWRHHKNEEDVLTVKLDTLDDFFEFTDKYYPGGFICYTARTKDVDYVIDEMS